jgi:paired amphipathic helix protein Sin3a
MTRDFDFSHCERPTPSYCAYPSDYPRSLFLSNSGQIESLDIAVLNNSVVCVGPERGSRSSLSYSPESYDGVRIRKNAYEEALFKIEDERFEVDMAVERNALTMREIEPMAEEATRLRETEEKDGQPIGRLQYQLRPRTLNTTHINSIARVYGDLGDEVLQHLARNPLVVLPIVYQRLRQKDSEWRAAKNEMMDRWNVVVNANYEGSLDVKCYFSRKEVERCFSVEQLRQVSVQERKM